MEFRKYFKKDVLVFGLGITGNSIINYLRKVEANIFIWDDNEKKINKSLKKFRVFNPLKKSLCDFEVILVSPGVSKKHFLIQNAIKKKVQISNDIELFWQFEIRKKVRSTIIGITGTNGKSTIALMISSFLKTQPLGNFGNPILASMNKDQKYYVIELSSFQLDYIKSFKPNISIISNITNDHIDYHETFDKYLRCKLNIFKNQSKSDYLIINFDDKNIRASLNKKKNLKVKLIKISCDKNLKNGVFVKNNIIYDNFFTNKKYIFSKNNFYNLKHNQFNLAASFSTLLLLGINPVNAIEGLLSFKGLPHRLEFIGSIKKVDFYNDSKATNVAATCSALGSFDKVILIAGGSDKGDSFFPLKKFSNTIVDVYLIGVTASKIAKCFSKNYANNICDNLQQAVERSYKKSISSGRFYPVLFSPACASFDSYKNYEHRGQDFKKIFKKLKRRAA